MRNILKLLPAILLGSMLFGCTYEVYDDPYWDEPPPPGPSTCCDEWGCYRCGYYHHHRHWRPDRNDNHDRHDHRDHGGGKLIPPGRAAVPPGGVPAPPAKAQPLKTQQQNTGSGGPGWEPPKH